MTAGLNLAESGSGKVVIEEPKIYIDPRARVDGVLATDLYKIVYSEGIIPFDES